MFGRVAFHRDGDESGHESQSEDPEQNKVKDISILQVHNKLVSAAISRAIFIYSLRLIEPLIHFDPIQPEELACNSQLTFPFSFFFRNGRTTAE